MVLICPPDPGVTQTEAQHKMARNTKTQKCLEYKTQTEDDSDVVYDAYDGFGNGGVMMMMMILVIVVYVHVGVSKLWGLLFL